MSLQKILYVFPFYFFNFLLNSKILSRNLFIDRLELTVLRNHLELRSISFYDVMIEPCEHDYKDRLLRVGHWVLPVYLLPLYMHMSGQS